MSDLFRNLIDAAEATRSTEGNNRSGGVFGRLSLALDAIEADKGEYREAYNGWPNRETWNTALWINNDESLYSASTEVVRDSLAEPLTGYQLDTDPENQRRGQLRAAGDALKEWYADAFDETNDGAPNTGPVADAWQYALAVTDWYRIAEGIAEGIEE